MDSADLQPIDIKRSEKFYSIRKALALSQADFGQKLGMPQGHVTKYEKAKRIIGKNIEYKLLKEFNVNQNWWHNDVGPMFDLEKSKSINLVNKGIAYYEDVDVTAGPDNLFTDGSLQPTGYIQIPHFEDCDTSFPLWGDSMWPLYQSGQIVMCKEFLPWRDYVPYGEVFLVVTDSLRTVKYVKPASSEDKYLLVSENPHFDSFEISKEHIRRMFIVKGSVKRNMI